MKENKRCYVYTRVSTEIQVDGYSLEAQLDEIKKAVDREKMIICGYIQMKVNLV